jgi:hypothetical protein
LSSPVTTRTENKGEAMNEDQRKELTEIMEDWSNTLEDEQRILLSLTKRYQERRKIAEDQNQDLEEKEKIDRELLEELLNSYGCPTLKAAEYLLFIWQISDNEKLLEGWINRKIDTYQAKEIAIRKFLYDQYEPLDEEINLVQEHKTIIQEYL